LLVFKAVYRPFLLERRGGEGDETKTRIGVIARPFEIRSYKEKNLVKRSSCREA